MTHVVFIEYLVTRHPFLTILGEKETQMFYVASFITFNVFLGLQWNPTLNSYITS